MQTTKPTKHNSVMGHLSERLQDAYFNQAQVSIFDSVVNILSDVLKVKYCLVGIFNSKTQQVDIRSLCTYGKHSKVFSYDLKDTPCYDIMSNGCVVVKEGVDDLYPNDYWLADNNVKSYIGVPLYNPERKTIGHLVVMDEKPIEDEELVLFSLEICSARLSEELIKELNKNEREVSERKYRNLFQNALEAKLIYDYAEGVYVDCNTAACELFKIAKEEFLKQEPRVFVPDGLDGEWERIKYGIDRINQGAPSYFLGETVRQKFDGTPFEAEVSLSKIQLEKNEMVVTVRDISKRKKAEVELTKHKDHLEELVEEGLEEIKKLNEELSQKVEELNSTNQSLNQALHTLKKTQFKLIQSEKMAALGTLTSGIAHELNNALNAIQGGSGLARKNINQFGIETSKLESSFEALGFVDRGALRASNIVSGLKAYSEHSKDQLIQTSIDQELEGLLATKESKISFNLNLNAKDSIHIYGRMFRRALGSIIDNSIYYHKGEGKASIMTSLDKQNEEVRIEVRNQGEQIPENILNKVFEPLFTTKAPGEGEGLGLAIAYSFVQHHNGSIEIVNHPDGVSFIVTIPSTLKESTQLS